MKLHHGTIVLAADAQKALIFRNEGDEKYPVLQTLGHEEAETPPSREIGSDRRGRSHTAVGNRRTSYEETDWHRQLEERFAVRAAQLLQEAAQGNDEDLIILAPPRFLGWLRDELPKAVRQRLIGEIDKDFTKHEADDVIAAITAQGSHPVRTD